MNNDLAWSGIGLHCAGLALMVVILLAGCGGGEEQTTTEKRLPPVNVVHKNGQYIVNVDTEEQADAQCEDLQSHWPDSVEADSIYFYGPGNETLVACEAP